MRGGTNNEGSATARGGAGGAQEEKIERGSFQNLGTSAEPGPSSPPGSPKFQVPHDFLS